MDATVPFWFLAGAILVAPVSALLSALWRRYLARGKGTPLQRAQAVQDEAAIAAIEEAQRQLAADLIAVVEDVGRQIKRIDALRDDHETLAHAHRKLLGRVNRANVTPPETAAGEPAPEGRPGVLSFRQRP